MAFRRGFLRRLRVVLVVGSALAAAVALAPAAAAAPSVGVIAGTVRGVDGAGLRHVTVAVVYVGIRGDAETVASTTTGRDGRYRLAGDFDSTGLQLQFTPDGATGGTSSTGYADLCYGGAPWCAVGGTSVQLTAGERLTADAILQRAGALTGRAVDALGRGIGSFPVSLWAGNPDQAGDAFTRPLQVTTTDADGNYSFTRLPTWSFGQCFGNGDGSSGVPVVELATPARDGYLGRCTDGAPVRTTAPRTTRSDVQLVGGGGAAGRVVDAAGRPIAGATVRNDTAFPNEAITSADGTFRIGLLEARPAYVCAGAAGYTSTCVDIVVRSFTTTRVGPVLLQRNT